MADRLGSLNISGSGGDTGLDVLLDYIKTWLNLKAAAAWTVVAPSLVPVRSVFAHDPEERSFNEKHLPALYMTRQSGVQQWLAEDYRVSDDTLRLYWVFPPVPQAHQRLRDNFVNRVAKSIDIAVERGSFPTWVHERDLADIDAILLSTATVTVSTSLAGTDLTGVVGVDQMPSPRLITATASAVVGAYSLSPIVVDGIDDDDEVVSDSLTPSSVNGGWTVTGTVEMARVTRIAIPAQSLTTGALSFGHTADEQANVEGSQLIRHFGALSLRMSGWKQAAIRIAIDGKPPQIYEAMEVTFLAQERWTRELDDDFDLLAGVNADIVKDDGSLTEQAIYE